MADSKLQLPTPFNFKNTEEWPKMDSSIWALQASVSFTRRWRRATSWYPHLYNGRGGRRYLSKLRPEERRRKELRRNTWHVWQTLLARRNVIFERTKFNMRKQEPQQPVDTFITALYCLAEYCEFGPLKRATDNWRDRIVIGIAMFVQPRMYSVGNAKRKDILLKYASLKNLVKYTKRAMIVVTRNISLEKYLIHN